MKTSLHILALFCSFSLTAQVTTYYDIAYHRIDGVDSNLLSLDISIPDLSQPMPIAIYVHGGGWSTGDKARVHEKQQLLTDLGYIFVSINYRLSPNPFELDNPDRITYPIHPSDVARAVAFILDNGVSYGGDTSNVFLFGHSAGAHLAALVATDESFLSEHNYSPDNIKCLCALDTTSFDIPWWMDNRVNNPDLYINAFTDQREIWMLASPFHQVKEGETLPDFLFVTQINPNREQANQTMIDQINALTSSNTNLLTTNYTHQEINVLLGNRSTDEAILYTNTFVSWLKDCMSTSITNSIDYNNITPTQSSTMIADRSIVIKHVGQYQLVKMNDGTIIDDVDIKFSDFQYDISNLTSGYYILRNGNTVYRFLKILH